MLAGATTIKRMTRSGSAGAYAYANATAADSLYMVFTARGATTTSDKLPAFYKICDSGNTAVKGRIVQVNVVGKISLDSTSATCP